LAVLDQNQRLLGQSITDRRTSVGNIERQIATLDTGELVKVWQDDWKKTEGGRPRYRCYHDTGGIPIAHVDVDLWRGTNCCWSRTDGSVFEGVYQADFWVNCIGHVKIYVRKRDQHKKTLAQLRVDQVRISAEMTQMLNEKIRKVDDIIRFIDVSSRNYQSTASKVPLERLCRGGQSQDRIERTFQDLVGNVAVTRSSPVPTTPYGIDI
jgi:hypothetical protein